MGRGTNELLGSLFGAMTPDEVAFDPNRPSNIENGTATKREKKRDSSRITAKNSVP
jgi:hypothetical protein